MKRNNNKKKVAKLTPDEKIFRLWTEINTRFFDGRKNNPIVTVADVKAMRLATVRLFPGDYPPGTESRTEVIIPRKWTSSPFLVLVVIPFIVLKM